MISAHDMALGQTLPTGVALPLARSAATPRAERLLQIVLFVTVLASSFAFVEPSPHDVLMALLAFVCVICGVRFERILVVPLQLLLVFNVSGTMSLLNVVSEDKTVQYVGTSVYLAVAALLFACLFARNSMARLATMRTAYLLTATLASLAGIAGYFHLFPHAYDWFTMEGRVLGGFKDPNVFGPFLILPLLIEINRLMTRGAHLNDVVATPILLFALLLCFSRGAWFHFGLSCAVMIALSLVTAPTRALRVRIVALTVIAVCVLAALLAILLSFESIATMFKERAQLLQSYDVGSGGRFRLQELAVGAVLQYPNGMGPFGFAQVNGTQQHNVYLQAFMVYGWTGGITYILLLITTLLVGLRTALTRAPWQPYVITALAAFVGEIAEGFIIDTDHWRHFFLLLGIIWGLAAATDRYRREAPRVFAR
jgi:hypothetical protein